METATTEALTARDACARCDGQGRLLSKVTDRYDGPTCPTCRGKGVPPVKVGPMRKLIDPDDSAAIPLIDDLNALGLMRAEWSSARTDEGAAMRKEIAAEIKARVTEAMQVGLRLADIAAALGLSRQGLDLILRDRRRPR